VISDVIKTVWPKEFRERLKMFDLANVGKRWRRIGAAIVVLLVVSSLTVSVATRYCSPPSVTSYAVKTLHKHSSPERSRQRLTKSSTNWITPAVRTVALEAPTSYPRIAPAGPPMPNVLLEKSLYNRPPPSC
jgi:hypothetical protein